MDIFSLTNIYYKKAFSNIWYHGSPFSGIAHDFSNYRGYNGILFLTKNKHEAREYAGGSLGSSAKFSGNRQPTIYIVEIGTIKIFDLRTEEDQLIYNNIVNKSKEVDPEMPLSKLDSKYFIRTNSGLPHFETINNIKQYIINDFDGAYVEENANSISLALFKPAQTAKIISEELI